MYGELIELNKASVKKWGCLVCKDLDNLFEFSSGFMLLPYVLASGICEIFGHYNGCQYWNDES